MAFFAEHQATASHGKELRGGLVSSMKQARVVKFHWLG